MLKKIKQFIIGLFASFYIVEKKVLTPNEDLAEGISLTLNINEGKLADDLMRGEVTQQVKELRWRMYKILYHTKLKDSKITGYDEEGYPILETTNTTLVRELDGLDIDMTDNESFPLKMWINNERIELGFNDMDLTKEEYTLTEVNQMSKSNRRIGVSRGQFLPKFRIEDYTEFLVVRENEEKNILLELYISRYEDIYDKRTKFLIKEIEKAKSRPRMVDMLDIENISFITNEDKGVPDLLEFTYEVKRFHSIVEYKSHYVVKFLAEPIIDGRNVIESFIDHDLDKRYENKEAKT